MMLFNEGHPQIQSGMDGLSAAPGAGPFHDPARQQQQQQYRIRRKRKADTQDAHNERLSKRLSLLNLEHGGQKLYVPVETPQAPAYAAASSPLTHAANPIPHAPSLTAERPIAAADGDSNTMQLDDTKHKVYIYNLDDELSSESEAEDSTGRLVFLPDIEKHLLANRIGGPGAPVGIPRPILPNEDGELAGMQMVLYNEAPSSITVPEERDSVRKAIIEARARIRQRQADERGGEALSGAVVAPDAGARPAVSLVGAAPPAAVGGAGAAPLGAVDGDDPDAMDLD